MDVTDPRPELWVAGDESGNFALPNSPQDRYFLVATLTGAGDDIVQQLDQLAAELRTTVDHPSMESLFHAQEDIQLTRDRVFDLIGSYGLRIDVTIVDKSQLPQGLLGKRSYYLYSLAWYHHIISVIPGIMHPTNKVKIYTAELADLSKRQAAKEAEYHSFATVQVPYMIELYDEFGSDVPEHALVEIPALMFFREDAANNRLLQVADYCAWAIHRRLTHNDQRWYPKVAHLLRSERFLRFRRRDTPLDRDEPQMVGLMHWQGLPEVSREYDVSATYTKGPVDSFQALLALEDAARADDICGVIDALEMIDPEEMPRRWFQEFAGAIAFISDHVIRHPDLGLRGNMALVNAIRYLLQLHMNDEVFWPLLAPALYNQGLILQRMGRNDEAVAVYDEVIDTFAYEEFFLIACHVAKALVNRGNALRNLGNEDDGLACYRQVILAYSDELDPRFEEPVTKAFRMLMNAAVIRRDYRTLIWVSLYWLRRRHMLVRRNRREGLGGG